MNYNPIDIFTATDLEKIIAKNEIHSDVIIRGENIKKLEKVEKVNGFLGVSDSTIESFGTLKEVKGNLFISTNTVFSNIKSLNNLEFVGGDLILRYSNIEDLGALKKVGGKLSLRDTKIKDLGFLEFVGGDLFLPKRLEKVIDLTNLTIKGKVKFWNDSKTREKIIPKSEMGYFDYNNPVPHWNHKYIYSFREIGEANSQQLAFYRVYKNHFLNEKYIDVKGNDNYSFILFYDLLENHNSNTKELQSHLKNLQSIIQKQKCMENLQLLKN